MKFRVVSTAVLTLAAIAWFQPAHAASLRVNAPTAGETRVTQSPSALRRAERVRQRLQRRKAVEARRQERLAARRSPSKPTDDRGSSVTDRVLDLVNAAREKEGVGKLSVHPALERTAQAYAEDMAKRGFFAHEDPEGRTPYERILAGGYEKPACNCAWKFGTGENLAQGQRTPEQAVNDWLESPGHRANILREDFEDTGIGYFDGHWVQLFGVSKVLR